MKCGNCGYQNESSAKFCVYCGKKIVENGVPEKTNNGKMIGLICGLVIVVVVAIVLVLVKIGDEETSRKKSRFDRNTSESDIQTTGTVQNSEDDANQWTEVLYSDGEFKIVRKDVSTYNTYEIQVGVLDSNGNWIVPLSSDFIFAKAIQNESGRLTLTGTKTEITKRNVECLGEGVFVLSLGVNIMRPDGLMYSVGGNSSVSSAGLTCYMFNAYTGEQNSFEAVWITKCYDGNMLMYNSSRYNDPFYRVDVHGNVFELPVEHEVNDYELSGYSEGLFFANGYFYDIYGQMVLDLTGYAITNVPYFVNGICEIEFTNPGGVLYRATIDKKGNFVSWPEEK